MRRSRLNLALAYEIFHPKPATAYSSGGTAHFAQNDPRTIAFLHGILGNKKNWRTPAKTFLQQRPEFTAISLDHRGHGGSIAMNATSTEVEPEKPLTVATCANDMIDLFHYNSEFQDNFNSYSPPSVVCAHSFGGKVALEYLRQCADLALPKPQVTWVLDCLPGPYNRDADQDDRQQSVSVVMHALLEAPVVFDSRSQAVDYLLSHGIGMAIANWLANGMKEEVSTGSFSHEFDGRKFRFGFDIYTVKHLFEDFCELDMWDLLESFDQQDGLINFVRAGKNKAWSPEILQRFDDLSSKNPNIQLFYMPHVGHWLHSEDMLGLLKIINENTPIEKKSFDIQIDNYQ